MNTSNCSSRNLKKRRRKRLSVSTTKKKVQAVSADVLHGIKSKHPLHVLTVSELRKIRQNSILVKNCRFVNLKEQNKLVRQVFYNIHCDSIGKNLRCCFNMREKKHINLPNIKKQYLAIIIEIDYNLRNNDSIDLIGYNIQNSSNMALLFLSTYDGKISHDEKVNSEVDIFRKNKYNINGCANNHGNHFGTSGEIFGVGLVPKYNIDNNGLSFGEYALKQDMVEATEQDNKMNEIVACCLERAIVTPLRIIPKLLITTTTIGAAMSRILKEMSSKHNTYHKFRNVQNYMSSQMNVNVTTQIPHTELDVSSTIIHVPAQKYQQNDYGFEVKFNHFLSFVVKLIPGTTIIYSPLMITHRQTQTSGTETIMTRKTFPKKSKKMRESVDFINISTYFNSKLYNHIQCLLKRISNKGLI